jgi:hypothetical protein
LTDPGDNVEPARDAAHEVARKIKPQFTEGELIKVAWARNQAEAELIQGMLLEEGVPSVLRRTRGFDVPDFLAAGPRDIVVPAAGVEMAREVLAIGGVPPVAGAGDGDEQSLGMALKITAVILLAAGVTALIAWLALQAGG